MEVFKKYKTGILCHLWLISGPLLTLLDKARRLYWKAQRETTRNTNSVIINRTVFIEYINQYQQIVIEIYLMNISYIQGIVLNAVRKGLKLTLPSEEL